MRQFKQVLLTLSMVLALPAGVLAHAQGEDYVFFNFRDASIEGLFEIHFDDLREKLGLELGGDDASALAEIEARAPSVQRYIVENFSIGPEGEAPYPIEFIGQAVTTLPQGLFGQYKFVIHSGPLPDRLAVSHSMLYEGDRLHRGLLLVEYVAKTDTTYPSEYTALVFSPFNQEQVLDLTNIETILSPRDMIPQGVLHIWIGIDHILFLLALMLPTVLRRENGKWLPVESFSSALFNLLKIVTVFTIAHSVTLLLAALDFIALPSALVESVIALSIVLVAMSNVLGKGERGSLWVILALGLFHGLGFASVMGQLPFRMVDLLKGVIGFNIGVELGQLVIVALVFPVLYLLRRQSFYEPLVLKGASVLLALVAGWWFLERALGIG